MLEVVSKFYQATAGSLSLQVNELARVINQLQRKSKLERFVLVAMDSASESLLRMLAEA